MAALESLLREPGDPLARRRQVAPALVLAEDPDAEDDERVLGAHHARVGVDAELDLARVHPLPPLPVHLALLDVALEGLVGPAPDAHGTAVLDALPVGDPADTAAGVGRD